jgi:hypothetical protein
MICFEGCAGFIPGLTVYGLHGDSMLSKPDNECNALTIPLKAFSGEGDSANGDVEQTDGVRSDGWDAERA